MKKKLTKLLLIESKLSLIEIIFSNILIKMIEMFFENWVFIE